VLSCRYAGGDSIKHTVFDNVDRATLKVYSSQENVAGVKIPKFESVSEPGETKMELTGPWPRDTWGWRCSVALG
jgi:V-type H+-transporting ATPase subunit D